MRASPSRGREGSAAPKGRLVRRFFLAGFAVGFAWLWFVWPPPVWYRWAWPEQTAFMAKRRGQETDASRHGEQKGGLPKRVYQPVSREQIAPVMWSAVLVAEDHRFYQHAGIDYQEIREALGYRRDEFQWTNAKDRAELGRVLKRAWARRSQIRGASTITQQLAKNLYLSPSRNPLRKVKEALTAWRLEYWLGKERILELYLNVVELGPEVWGVEAASQKYFGHSARRLSLDEAAALAGTLPFPLKSNPGYHPGRMHWRQSMIVRRIRGEVVEIPRDTADLPDSVRADTTSRD